jgi:hypothetical protein
MKSCSDKNGRLERFQWWEGLAPGRLCLDWELVNEKDFNVDND